MLRSWQDTKSLSYMKMVQSPDTARQNIASQAGSSLSRQVSFTPRLDTAVLKTGDVDETAAGTLQNPCSLQLEQNTPT